MKKLDYKPILWVDIDISLFDSEQSIDDYKSFLQSSYIEYHVLMTWNSNKKIHFETIIPNEKSESELKNLMKKITSQIMENNHTELGIELLDSKCMPMMGSEEAACYDVYTAEETIIPANGEALLPLGFKLAIPKGYCVDLFARSSIRKLGLIITNSVGVIDSDYTGELKMTLTNLKDKDCKVEQYQKIGQIRLRKLFPLTFNTVENVKELKMTARGEGGFGSTGNK